MKVVEFNLVGGSRFTFFVGAGHFSVTETPTVHGNAPYCILCDGVHNNGGWKILGLYKEIIAKIQAA